MAIVSSQGYYLICCLGIQSLSLSHIPSYTVLTEAFTVFIYLHAHHVLAFALMVACTLRALLGETSELSTLFTPQMPGRPIFFLECDGRSFPCERTCLRNAQAKVSCLPAIPVACSTRSPHRTPTGQARAPLYFILPVTHQLTITSRNYSLPNPLSRLHYLPLVNSCTAGV